MTSSFSDKINKIVTSLGNFVDNKISTHYNKTGSSSQKGHVQSGSQAGLADKSGGAAGTDNGIYARADHQHVLSEAYATSGHTHSGYASSTHNHDGTYLKSYTPPTGSTTQAGIVQLEDSYSSTSTTKAATPNAVKAAYDLANGKPSLGTTATTAAAGNHTHSNYLTSHQSLKTINNESLVGTGNITIQSGNNVDIVTSWESTLSDSKVPSEKLVKNGLDGKASSSHTHGNLTNDGKLGTTSGKPVITTTDGKITTGSFGTTSGSFAEGNHTHSAYVNPTIDSALSSTSTNAVQNKIINSALAGKAASDHNHDGTYLKSYTPPTASTSQAGIVQLSDSTSTTSSTVAATSTAVKAAYDKGNHSHSSYVNPTIADNLTTSDATQVLSAKQGKVLQDNKLDSTTAASTYQPKGNYLTSHQSLSDIGGAVTIEKATSNIGNNIARYTIKQGGTALTNGVIDIPKDFLVKSGAVHTVGGSATGDKTASQLGTGYSTGDKYIDFVINTKGNDGTDEHIYINVKDLVDSTVTISRNLTSGTKIGTITINGVATDLYCETNTNTTYSNATQSAAGLMSSSDKTKLDGIDTGANKITVDTSLNSSSTNPVQNKVINTALNNKLDSTTAASTYQPIGNYLTSSDLPLVTANTLPAASSTYDGKICILTTNNGIELYLCDNQ